MVRVRVICEDITISSYVSPPFHRPSVANPTLKMQQSDIQSVKVRSRDIKSVHAQVGIRAINFRDGKRETSRECTIQPRRAKDLVDNIAELSRYVQL